MPAVPSRADEERADEQRAEEERADRETVRAIRRNVERSSGEMVTFFRLAAKERQCAVFWAA